MPTPSEQQFRDLMHWAQELFYQIDLDGRFIYVNPAWASATGYESAELVGQFFYDFQPTENKARDLAVMAEYLAKPHFSQYESALRHRNGSVIHVVFSGMQVLNEAGHLCAIQGFGIDITKLKLAEESARRHAEQLLESEERYRNLVDMGFEAIFIHENGIIVDLNRTLMELIGYESRDEIIGKNGSELVLAPESRAAILARLRSGETRPAQCWCIRKDGSRFLSEIQSRNITYLGRPMRLVTIRDITEQQKLMQAAQRSQKLESLGILAGGIAHDFNNLLGGIFGYLELIQAKFGDPHLAEYLSKAITTIDRARGLTQQLLTFAKGGVPIRKTEALFPFVEESVHFVLSGTSVTSRFAVAPDLMACDIDRGQIGQVLDNLTLNAQQAMPAGGTLYVTADNIRLRERQVEELPAGEYVHLSLRDTGVGIRPENLPHIFDPFFSTKPKGSGLGLATAYSIVKQHKGFIEVESMLGKGTVFHLYLPASPSKLPTPSQSVATLFKGSGRFVIMDDEPVIRETIGEMIKMAGFEVVAFAEGRALMDYLQCIRKEKSTVAAVMVDLTIPGGMGGREVIDEIRRCCTDVPIFVSSGYADDPIMAHPEQFGVTASLGKPFLRADLFALLQKHLPSVRLDVGSKQAT